MKIDITLSENYIIRNILILLISFSSFNINAQKKATIMIVNNGSSYNDLIVNIIQRYKTIGIIDQSSIDQIKLEKERQKGEDFINGYIVEQGKLSGADYILKHSYFVSRNKISNEVNDEILNISLISTKNNEVVSSRNIKLYKGLGSEFRNAFSLGTSKTNDISLEINSMLVDYFDFLKSKIVKPLKEKSDKVIEVLLLGGYNRGNEKGQQYKIIEYNFEEIEGLKRKILIEHGIVLIKSVDDDNFSTGTILEGEKKIKKLLEEKKTLYCLINQK